MAIVMAAIKDDDRIDVAQKLHGLEREYRRVELMYGEDPGIGRKGVTPLLHDIMHCIGVSGRATSSEVLGKLSQLIDPTCHENVSNDLGYELHECDNCGATLCGDENYCPDCGKRLV